MTTLEWILTALCVVAALWTVGLLVLDKLANDLLFGLLALIEVGLIVNLVLGIVRFANDADSTSGVNYIGYLIGVLLILPAAVLWSLAERNRGGTGVLLIGVLLVPFLFYR
ncbi:MAG: hypothetical protein EOO74_08605, partial [Myxococcales bacterium]